MKALYDSQYLSVAFDEEIHTIYSEWKTDTVNASATEIKAEMLTYADLLTSYLPTRILGDSSNFLFAVTAEMQVWMVFNFHSVANRLGVKKYASVTPNKTTNPRAVEQTKNEVPDQNYNVRYFKTKTQAQQWLFS